uniref:SOWAHA-C winged helix-turn-helix domain-containing protein n=1 Tax=Sinocyclocheilus anshuiensis TaxID=1608454 RepID=A0A671QJA3_9TELE
VGGVTISTNSVLRFIINNGGTVRNADLLTHYKRFLREDEQREQNRELFKRYVNSVATVRQEEGVSHVVLRKKYRVHLGDSSPCLLDRPVSPHTHSQTYNQAGLSRSNDSLLRPNVGFNGFLIQERDKYEPHVLFVDDPATYLQIRRPSSLSSSRDSVSIPSPSSTPPDTGWPHGNEDLSSPAGSTRSLSTSVHDGSFSSKHSSIPLDPREHNWFVKAASGTWTDIYALFRDDPNLLSKRDFISGFTVIHWIAKHGNHRVLNTLWYGVDKVGMTLDVNAKTLGGYTPLHLAAIHGHKKLIRLLVQKFKADVRIRDSSGKRPWQYLSKDEQRDILELLGAPQKRISGSPAMPANLSTRPATTKVNVKRHTSIAALFKHKSQLRVSSGPEALF